jgi:translocation and assembly module TamB
LPIPGTSPPQDYRIVIDAQVKDDGLGILNVLTRRRLAWLGGEGEVDVEITGQLNPETNRLDSLVAEGLVVLNGGVMGSKFLQQQITDLTGTIALNLDRIDVEQLSGSFGGGAIAIAGSLPTFERVPQDNPLTVQLAQLAVELPGAFSGDIAGQVQILGSALNPEVTGDIGVSDGDVQLLGVAALTEGETTGGESAIAASSTGFLEFRELNISLTDDFIIRQFPILELVARGDLTVNGIFPFIEPEGEIALTRGYVNIFTTTFRLDGNYDNRALLSPITGIDPYLDLRLVGSVIETQRRTLAVESFSSEVADNFNVGTSQSLQVRAEVQASALELVETLKTSAATGQRPGRRLIALRSSPSRSETEILALLGGTFINSVAGGNDDAIVGGIANIAGNALLGDIQASIARALSLTEFRVFPAPVIEPESKTPTGELGVALEIGKTVFDRASVSVVQFVTPENQPTRFNVRYRINDSFTVRGTTDFRGDDRAVIEFETRF